MSRGDLTEVEWRILRVLLPVERKSGTTPSGSTDCTARWACNCGTRRRNEGSRQSCARIGSWPHDRTTPGRWTSFMTSLRLGANCGCLRSLTRSRASRPRSNLGSTSAALMLWRYSKRSAGKSVSRKQSGSIKAQFVSRDLDLWAYRRGVTLDFSRPGKPTDNAFIESFNCKFRAECLNAHWFMSLDDARRKCEAWRRDYNEERPHSAIGNKAPIELIDRLVACGPRLAGKRPAGRSKDGEQFNRKSDSNSRWIKVGGNVMVLQRLDCEAPDLISQLLYSRCIDSSANKNKDYKNKCNNRSRYHSLRRLKKRFPSPRNRHGVDLVGKINLCNLCRK